MSVHDNSPTSAVVGVAPALYQALLTAAVTVAVIVLIPHTDSVWSVALFRFLEVSWGIAVTLTLALFAEWIQKRFQPK